MRNRLLGSNANRELSERQQLKRQVEALAEEQRLFRTLVENLPDMVTRLDRNLRHVYVSPNAEAVTGMPVRAQLGRSYAELGYEEADIRVREEALRAVFTTGQSYVIEDVSHPGSQNVHATRITYAPEFAPDGSVESALSITTDISELKRVEEELRTAKTVAESARQQELQRRREAERRGQIGESLRDVLTILNSNRQMSNIFEFITRQARQLLDCDAVAIFSLDSASTVSASTPANPTSQKPRSPTPLAAGILSLQATCGFAEALTPAFDHQNHIVGDAAVRFAMSAQKPAAIMAAADSTGSQAFLYLHKGGENWFSGLTERSQGTNNGVDVQISDATDFIAVRQESLPAPYQALLVIPIVAQCQVYGSLLLLYTTARRFSSEEVGLAMAYGDQVALAIANAELQAHIEHAARETERNQLARELHDTVTQEIFSASMLAESIPLVWDQHREAAEAGLHQVQQLTRNALAALRTLLVELRPAILEQKSLAELLRQLSEVTTIRTGAPVDLAIDEACPAMPLAVKVAYYRIAQEALTNAVKHANARHLAVHLRYLPADGIVRLTILDDGQGFELSAVPAGHFGIAMIRERARSVNASLRITSRRGHGSRIVVRWIVPDVYN